LKEKKFVTTKAALYGIPAIESYEHPEWFSLYWTGEYFCPKCCRAIPWEEQEKERR